MRASTPNPTVVIVRKPQTICKTNKTAKWQRCHIYICHLACLHLWNPHHQKSPNRHRSRSQKLIVFLSATVWCSHDVMVMMRGKCLRSECMILSSRVCVCVCVCVMHVIVFTVTLLLQWRLFGFIHDTIVACLIWFVCLLACLLATIIPTLRAEHQSHLLLTQRSNSHNDYHTVQEFESTTRHLFVCVFVCLFVCTTA